MMNEVAHLLFLFVASAAVDVQPAAGAPGSQLAIASDSSCLSGDAVQEELAHLRPATSWPADLVVIRTTPHWHTLDLGRRSGRRRQLAMTADCAARATSAALVIATWMDDLPAQVTGPPVLHSHDEKEKTPPEGIRELAHYETGTGVTGTVGGGLAPGTYADFMRLRSESGLGCQASAAAAAPRTIWLAAGNSRWMRTTVTLGAQSRKTYQKAFLAADLGLACAYTAAWGSGYGRTKPTDPSTGGAVAGVQGGIPSGRLRLWLAVRAGSWARPESIQVDAKTSAGSSSSELPFWEAQEGLLGVSYVLP
jgi:hypothetical protein